MRHLQTAIPGYFTLLSPEEHCRRLERLLATFMERLSPGGVHRMSAGCSRRDKRSSACAEMVVGSTGDGECPYSHHHDHHYTLVDGFCCMGLWQGFSAEELYQKDIWWRSGFSLCAVSGAAPPPYSATDLVRLSTLVHGLSPFFIPGTSPFSST